YYDEKMRAQVLWSQKISTQLHDALKNKNIIPYLQPIVDTDGNIKGAEALVRWIHPEKGFLSPASFIPVFEKNGMIVEVDKYMWRCACEILSRWSKEKRDLFLSVNISPKDFYFMDVAAELSGLVAEYGIPASSLRVEITETVMMNNSDDRMDDIRKLKEKGFIVEMDDFGSGYSSLNMLKDMPVDVLKIDMKFLSAAQDNERARTILANIIHLSGDLIIASLTEGVETAAQHKALTEMGCQLFQGYHFSKPVSVEEFEKMITQSSQSHPQDQPS
ncbi:MAG: EAL domain-containing protein, partial [Lachnospiraceae bacterium]|nr:EAL domain-containing protein [Lachnospiraceae bacterium]